MSELENCPFCGGKATLRNCEDGVLPIITVFVECTHCFAKSKSLNIDLETIDLTFETAMIKLKNELVDKWNARA